MQHVRTFVGGLLGAFLLGTVPASALSIILTDKGTGDTIRIDDGGAGDSNPTADIITYIGGVGGTSSFATNVTTTIAQNSSQQAFLNLNDLSVTSSTGGTLELAVSHSGYSLVPDPAPDVAADFSLNATAIDVSVTGRSYIDPGNVLFGTTTGVATGTAEAVGASGTSNQIGATLACVVAGCNLATSEGIASLPSPFSMSMVFDIVHVGGGTTSFDATTTAVVPLPAALPLFLTAMGGLGFFGWRRRRAALPA